MRSALIAVGTIIAVIMIAHIAIIMNQSDPDQGLTDMATCIPDMLRDMSTK